MSYRIKNCTCGGKIVPRARSGRVVEHRGRSVTVAAELEIPTCDSCGAEFHLLSHEVACAIDEAAERAYADSVAASREASITFAASIARPVPVERLNASNIEANLRVALPFV